MKLVSKRPLQPHAAVPWRKGPQRQGRSRYPDPHIGCKWRSLEVVSYLVTSSLRLPCCIHRSHEEESQPGRDHPKERQMLLEHR